MKSHVFLHIMTNLSAGCVPIWKARVVNRDLGDRLRGEIVPET